MNNTINNEGQFLAAQGSLNQLEINAAQGLDQEVEDDEYKVIAKTNKETTMQKNDRSRT